MQENFTILNRGAALERPTFPVKPLLVWVPEPFRAAILECRVIHNKWCGYYRKRFWTTTCSRRTNFRKKVSVEEQRAQTHDRFLRWRENCVHDLWGFPCSRSLWSSTRTLRFVQYTLAEWRRPRRPSMGSCTIISEWNSHRCDLGRIVQVKKLQDSSQHQTVLALYDQENVRNNGQPSYSRFKTSVRLHIGQMMRTRSFRVRRKLSREEQ